MRQQKKMEIQYFDFKYSKTVRRNSFNCMCTLLLPNSKADIAIAYFIIFKHETPLLYLTFIIFNILLALKFRILLELLEQKVSFLVNAHNTNNKFSTIFYY